MTFLKLRPESASYLVTISKWIRQNRKQILQFCCSQHHDIPQNGKPLKCSTVTKTMQSTVTNKLQKWVRFVADEETHPPPYQSFKEPETELSEALDKGTSWPGLWCLQDSTTQCYNHPPIPDPVVLKTEVYVDVLASGDVCQDAKKPSWCKAAVN